MTLEDLTAEIESGLLAKELAPLWADVFLPHPTKGEQLRHREGLLKTDAAFAIHKLLTAGSPSRSEQLGWGKDWPWKLVCAAKKMRRLSLGNR